MDPEMEAMIAIARERAKARPMMVVDGNPQEEIARALERHAERLRLAANGLFRVGTANYLGDTAEGTSATHNVRVAVVTHERSIYNRMMTQASAADGMADGMRRLRQDLERREREASETIRQAAQQAGG
ncbi:hypothetical protein [Tsukamurella strandjordii]|uniref:Uncharacterized protein n=1 Tax=Tsukamurella strandjordii TaxID=147577 RepID=A0AA90NBW8_9ACTN|nr:hypothetical protein [Tsukamurella strandjordii]MDP0398943.1 hypothetical protein [Tsukamurella strandjordii]